MQKSFKLNVFKEKLGFYHLRICVLCLIYIYTIILNFLSEISTTPSVPIPTGTPSLVPPYTGPLEPTMHLRCAWSPWLNSDRPDVYHGDVGDLETIAGLKTKFGLCKSIADIQCRVAGTNTPVSAAGQKGVTCDAVNGLRCYNGDQPGGLCYDYEVSVLCWSPECTVEPTVGTTLVPGIGFTGRPMMITGTLVLYFSKMKCVSFIMINLLWSW